MPRRSREHAPDDLEVRNVLAEIMNAFNATASLCARARHVCELPVSTTHAASALHALPHALQLPAPTGWAARERCYSVRTFAEPLPDARGLRVRFMGRALKSRAVLERGRNIKATGNNKWQITNR